MKKISILGSTGSIGTQTLDVVRANKDIKVAAISAGSNIELLEKQIREFEPEMAVVWDEKKAGELKAAVKDKDVKILSGMDGLTEIVKIDDVDTVVGAIVGMIGIRPVMEAIRSGKDIALANKETLVTAGHLIMDMAEKAGVRILPVDSEHSAIFQCLHKEDKREVRRLLLTASGGPFRGKKREDLVGVTAKEALRHPNWSMGAKITIDSATMMNKGLEVIEAKWLFDVDIDDIQILVQPQSVIHSAVEFIDGGVIAQLGTPDMRLPISYALYYPHRRFIDSKPLDLFELGSITFERPDTKVLKGPALAVSAFRRGGTMPTVMNAANERAVAMFLAGKIHFLDIYDIIEECMAAHTVTADPSLDEILAAEQQTYSFIESRW